MQVGANVLRLSPEEDTLLRAVAEQKIAPCRERIEAIRAFKRARDAERLRAALGEVRAACAGSDNLMPHIMAAMRAAATAGEISGVMRLAYGLAYDPFGMVEPPA